MLFNASLGMLAASVIKPAGFLAANFFAPAMEDEVLSTSSLLGVNSEAMSCISPMQSSNFSDERMPIRISGNSDVDAVTLHSLRERLDDSEISSRDSTVANVRCCFVASRFS